MWKKMLLLVFALCLMAAANVESRCTVSVCGKELDGLYSPGQVRRACLAAGLAAEEIVRGEAVPPVPVIRQSLRFCRVSGSIPALTDAILRGVDEVDITYSVYVKDERLGAVADGPALRKELKEFITNQLPTWAISGEISEKLDIFRHYGRSEGLSSTEDMVLLITGAAPVFFSDGQGYISRA